MSTFDPNFNLEYDWAFRESGWKDGMDNNLLKIGSVIQLSVLSRTTDIPATPSEGDRYIIPANATGDWTGKDDQIAVYVNASWVYYAPVVGWWCYVEDSEERVQYISVGWSVFAISNTFIGLGDTPSAYTDQAGRALRVNATVDGLEFFDAALAVHTHVVGDIEDTGGLEGQVPTINSVGEVVWADPPGASGGEANTASNRGEGEGIFAAKSGVDLEFKSLVAGSGVTLSSDTNEITITADGGGSSSELEVSTETVTAYTLVAADAGKYIRMDHADPNTVTVPDDAALTFPTGTQIHIRQAGAGQTSIAGATGVTINTAETLNLRTQHSTATLVKIGADEWDLMGDLEASA